MMLKTRFTITLRQALRMLRVCNVLITLVKYVPIIIAAVLLHTEAKINHHHVTYAETVQISPSEGYSHPPSSEIDFTSVKSKRRKVDDSSTRSNLSSAYLQGPIT